MRAWNTNIYGYFLKLKTKVLASDFRIKTTN